MSPVEVREATDAAEIDVAVATLWPVVEAGQVGFPLAAQGSVAALTERWLRCLEAPDGHMLIASRNGDIVGAAGVLVSDSTTLQTIHGPVASVDHAEVFDAFCAEVERRHPGARLLVGLSHRHTPGNRWAARRGRLVEHSFPLRGPVRRVPARESTHLVTDRDAHRFTDLYDDLVGTELWWTAERIRARWGEWLCIVDAAWVSLLAARLCPGGMTEVFAVAGEPARFEALLARWLTEAEARGYRDAVFFAGAEEREAGEAVGLICVDEYRAWEIRLSRPGE